MRDAQSLSRRQFLTALKRSSLNDIPHKQPGSARVDQVDDAEFTPVDRFPQQHVFYTPEIRRESWSMTLDGADGTQMALDYAGLLRRDAVEIPCTLVCSGHGNGSSVLGHARWQGVRLRDLIDGMSGQATAQYVQFVGADGYATSIARDSLQDALIAYGMNGEPLRPEHGFPARLIVPGLYSYKLPKWLIRIAFTETPYAGFWEQRGWPEDGIAPVMSRIRSPYDKQTVHGSVTLRGMAYSGRGDVTKIEVAIDDGPWMPVVFTPAERGSWIRWQIDWTPPVAAAFVVKVRATDSAGFTQTDPHAVVINVSA